MSFFPDDSLHAEILGDQARPNQRVKYFVRCGQCDGFVPVLRSTCVSVLGRPLCRDCRQFFEPSPST